MSLDISGIVLALSGSLDTLQSALDPILQTPLEELVADVEPLEKAKLEVTVAYLVHDLIWSKLRIPRQARSSR